MKIGFVADTYRPYISGVTHYIALNKQEFERRGHQVTVFAFGQSGKENEQGDVVLCGGGRLPNGYAYGFHLPKLVQERLRSMDVVHSNHPFLSGPLAASALQGLNTPLLFTSHTRYDEFFVDYLPFIPHAWGRAWMRRALNRYFRYVDQIICPSKAALQVYQALGMEVPVKLIPNGVDLQPFRVAREQKSPGEGRAEIVVVNVSRLGPEKNQLFLIRAFARAAGHEPRLRLRMVGQGPYRSRLEQEIRRLGMQERVQLMGGVEYHEVPRVLAEADFFAIPSLTEVHPLTVIEALGCGLPVVALHSEALYGLVQNGFNGLLVEADEEAYADALLQLARSPELRIDFGKVSARIAEDYAIERTAGLLLDEYERLLARPRKAGPA